MWKKRRKNIEIMKKGLQKFVYYKKKTYLCTRLTKEVAKAANLLRRFYWVASCSNIWSSLGSYANVFS